MVGVQNFRFLLICAVLSICVGMSEVPLKCTNILTGLAEVFAKFEFCALNSSRPFQVCRRCAPLYKASFYLFDDLIMGKSNASQECIILVNGGQLSLVKDGFKQIQKIWEDGVCEDCFDPDSTRVSSQVEMFFEEANNVEECMDNAPPNQTCSMCEEEFGNLTEYFKNVLHAESDKGHCLCGDVIDKMNSTRHQWGNLCFMPDDKLDIWVISAASITCIVVTLFYVIARVLQNPKDTELARVNTLQSVYLEEEEEEDQEEQTCDCVDHTILLTEGDQVDTMIERIHYTHD